MAKFKRRIAFMLNALRVASPLHLAALITWLAVLAQSLRFNGLRSGDPLQLFGLLSLCAVAGLYFGTMHTQSARGRGLMVIGQGLLVLVGTWCFRNGGPAILLIVVASQMVAMFQRRNALALMIALNVGMALIYSVAMPWANVLLFLTPLIGFQLFAALTMHYAVSAEAARAEVQRTHAHLLATQQLLAESTRGDERLKLSRELHDVAGHKLTALKLNLRLLRRQPALAENAELGIAAQLADELLDDIRAVVSELRRHDGIDLPAAIELLTRQIPGPGFEVDIDPELRIADVARAEALLRCVQEGITNALKHGQPTAIRIGLKHRDGRIALTVEDNGQSRGEVRFGNGLNGMRERLADIGGVLEVIGTASGVRLLAEVPA